MYGYNPKSTSGRLPALYCANQNVTSNNNSVTHTLLFALSVALVFGAMVTVVSVLLAPAQADNREKAQQRLFTELMMSQPGFEDVLSQTASFEMVHRLLDLDSGCYDTSTSPRDYASVTDPSDPERRRLLSKAEDIAGISYLPQQVIVHLIVDGERVVAMVLPVYGLGYASRLNGYLTLAADGSTIRSLTFYDHSETPGMGGRISNPAWQAQWQGKRLRDEQGRIRIGVAKDTPVPEADRPYQIDAMSGATLTGRGVTNLLRFWVGPLGFEPYLANLAANAKCTALSRCAGSMDLLPFPPPALFAAA